MTETHEHEHHEHEHDDHSAHDDSGHDRRPGRASALASQHGPEMAHAHSSSAHDHSAHDHSAHDPAQFRRKFWLSLVLTIPTLVFSHGLQDILGLDGPRFPGSQYIPAVFGLAIFVYGGWVFITGAIHELRMRQPGMMTLISLAIVVALGYSLAVTLGLPGMDFWWELATLITIMLLGHWIEMSAVMGAQDALGELAKLIPDEAELVHGDHTMTVAVSSLALGDNVIVRPGARVPVDGVVVEGESDVDEALLTGESVAVEKAEGASVVAGSINGGGSLTVRVDKVGGDTALAGIMRMVAEAQASKSGVQVLADRAAAWLFYVAIAAALVTLVAWLLLRPDEPSFVLERVVTVLIIACPHALGLAIPLVAQISTAIGAKHGLLVRSRSALEEARRVDVVLFDKTGTLTRGEQGVTDAVAASADTGEDVDRLIALAAAVEAKAEHPIGRAIVAEAKARGLKVERATKFEALAGRGAQATVSGRTLTVASRRVVNERGLLMPAPLVHSSRGAADAGKTIVYLMDDDAVVGMIALADIVREESFSAVSVLKKRGIRVAMLTGDSHEVGASVAGQLGIDEVFAEVLPGQKADVVAKLQAGGTVVAMVGDGVNDAPALAQADIGIAIGAGTDVAIESAGIVLASSDPRGVAKALTLSRATYTKMQQNLFWATGYNVIAIPLAAGVLAGAGILLSPALGAVLMSISTIVVALNAQLLRRLRLR